MLSKIFHRYGALMLSASVLFLMSCNFSADQQDPWTTLEPLPLDPAIEAQIDDILPKLSLEQKVGQVIQADNSAISPEDVKKYRLGSVLSGGNSAPGPLPYADAKTWVTMADAFYEASVDTEGVEITIPLILGIDAVHGHANLEGAIVFPHNIGLGAANNPDLIEEIARITAHELTVSGHDWTFAPTLAVPQDLRWGRSYEGFSEDPSIVNAYASRVVEGLQGRFATEDFMGEGTVISSAKHFLADGATENGVDQGDAKITEQELSDVHAAGYYSAIPAGVQTVMASFNSWNGRKLHGDKELLTDVLKGKMGFNGFVVGDWNGHGQVPGCTNTDCAQSFNAGVDMFMAPDSWRGLYDNTLAQVQDGTISMERLDDAVRRILRVKIASGLFEKGLPSQRKNAGDETQLGLPEHRAIARQAVRESMVLLKNNDQLLPLDAASTVLVVGDGANSISKASGGWTLSWQGTGHSNDEFPNGESILRGIQEAVDAAGGKVIFSAEGAQDITADVVIAVYGEDPYAEFQGDRNNLDFEPNGFDVATLASYQEQGIPVVSVFLSGRPLWTNPEINASDAFIAAWLPGSEGGGVSDLLFQTNPSYDFTGTLSFSWPSSGVVSDEHEALFGLGYGLNYSSKKSLETLPIISGLENSSISSSSEFYTKGVPVEPWGLWLSSGDLEKQIASYPTSVGGLIVSKTDHQAQEDALRIRWTQQSEDYFRISTTDAVDLSRESNGAMELSFSAKSFGEAPAVISVGLCEAGSDCENSLEITLSSDWDSYEVSLSCFEDLGIDVSKLGSILALKASEVSDIGLNNVRLMADVDATKNCGN